MLKIFKRLGSVNSRFKLRSVTLFLLLSVLCLWLIVPGVVSAQVVDIPDPGLRAAIVEVLNKAPDADITRTEMETLVELRAVGREITDLRGIEFAINLTWLGLWSNTISDISPLANLTNLTVLYLNRNTITDISALSRLTNLTVLYLNRNTISDISPLANLTNLTRLDLGINTISNIVPLIPLTNLTELYLNRNNISDISAVATLTNLTYLNLGGNTISNIVPLIPLTNLTELYLWQNNISDISAVATLTNLTVLSLSYNTISNIVPLLTLTNLTYLNLGGNTISDIFPLIPLTNLRSLYLWRNTITDISSLSGLTNLTVLSLHNNTISDILPLLTLTNLSQLYIQNNNIWDIETLERLMAQGTIVFFRGNPAFEPPGPKIEDEWVWLFVPAMGVTSGSDAARSGRDFLSEASGGAVTEADVAVKGASAGTSVGESVWTSARLDATDPNNLNTLLGDNEPPLPEPPLEPQVAAIGESVWTPDRFDTTDPDKRNALMPPDANLETHIPYPVAYGVVSIQSEIPQQTRIYIGAGPVKVYLNGALVYRDTYGWEDGSDYETAVPVMLNAGNNLLFIAAYRLFPESRWGAFFGFQDGTVYTVEPPGPGNLDVNGDGQVDVLDLVQVALFYGKRGDNLPEDINADGVINVPDLVAVAEGIDAADDLSLAVEQALLLALGEAAALEAIPEAPIAGGRHPHALSLRLTSENVAAALADVRILARSDARFGKWLPLLEELLHLLAEMRAIPETTALLPNYPNPFNPETWLPYQLSTPSAVMLSIYSVDGQLVRTLDLGHQPAGVYRSRERAAYWDGRNQLGEKVASGLYFYTLTTGDFTATRKLLIAK